MELIPTLSESDTVLPDPLLAINADKRSADWTKDTESSFSWIWTGSYLVSDSAMGGTSKSTDKVITVSVPGYSSRPSTRKQSMLSRASGPSALKINSEGKTWRCGTGQWDLPSVKSNGTHALLCKPVTDQLVLHLQDKTNHDCHLCGEKKIANWRVHIGTHLYRFQRGLNDELLTGLEHGDACGFCGRCGAPECAVSLTRTQTTSNVVSNCPRYSEFRYGSADNMPCRNVPVLCTLCNETAPKRKARPAHWRYNMRLHLKEERPEYASLDNPDGLHPLPHALWESIRVQSSEEEKLGIPEALAQLRSPMSSSHKRDPSLEVPIAMRTVRLEEGSRSNVAGAPLAPRIKTFTFDSGSQPPWCTWAR
ncbi:hypothetical protein HMN09_01168400 [Mycena chlorophos]|uniref:Uncharacterized protein n=1 Tax=Mycena chlorophos TaxID=658473 RepID=A0A8H6VTU8_MYCCL|nr:hypothetical protein HMN09_01168400 [Mycena chlorophos]